MKPTTFIILLFCFAINAIAQDYPDSGVTNRAEAKNLMVNSLKEGKWIQYDIDTGRAQKSLDKLNYILTIYKEGKPAGLQREYTSTGELIKVTPYANGVKNGIVKSYYYDGELKSETPYVNGILNGDGKVYYEHLNGKLKSVSTYSNGTKEHTTNYNEKGNEIK